MGIAIEFVAKYMAATDSLLRLQYPGCDSIIHQIEEEINSTWDSEPGIRTAQGDTVYPKGYFMAHEGDNQTNAYRFFFSVVDSIATLFAGLADSRSSTAVECVYYRPVPDGDNFFGNVANTRSFRAAMFDSMTHVDAFIINPAANPEDFYTEINAVRDSLLAHNNTPKRRLGLRYSWHSTGPSIAIPVSQQVEMLDDFKDNIPNADFLTFWDGSALDGQKGDTNFVAARTHFDALAIWKDMHLLHFIDHFSDTLDTDVWDQSGTVSFSDSTVVLYQNANIQTDSIIEVPDLPVGGITLRSHHNKSNEQGSQWHGMKLVKDANNMVHFYTQQNYLHCYVTEGGVLTGERFETIGTSLNAYEVVYNKIYDYVRFYFNGTFKKQINLSSDFDVNHANIHRG